MNYTQDTSVVEHEFAAERTTYIASVRNEKGEHFCGGALINRKFILTAGHCIENVRLATRPKFKGIYVVVGTVNSNNPAVRHIIKQLNVTSSFIPRVGDYNNDIGLITVSHTIIKCKFKINCTKFKIDQSSSFLTYVFFCDNNQNLLTTQGANIKENIAEHTNIFKNFLSFHILLVTLFKNHYKQSFVVCEKLLRRNRERNIHSGERFEI